MQKGQAVSLPQSGDVLKAERVKRPQPFFELLDDLFLGIINTTFCSRSQTPGHSGFILIPIPLPQL